METETTQSVMSMIQRGLETLYRLEPELPVSQFLLSAAEREAVGTGRRPKEQLLLLEDSEGMSIGLFVDPEIVDSITGVQTSQLLLGQRFGDFMMVLEGVSHFVYLAFRVGTNRTLSALELELQAEVDKYATCLLSGTRTGEDSAVLRQRLFKNITYDVDLIPEEKDRYRVANDSAWRYSESLERRYVRSHRIADMLVELRNFYRMDLQGKLDFIQQAA